MDPEEKTDILQQLRQSVKTIQASRLTHDFARENPEIALKLSKHQLIYSVIGLVLGLVCIIGGIVLFLNGVTGSINWTTKFLGVESTINDAAPGVFLFIVGLYMVFVTRYIFKVQK